jgi:hypothetical protein
MGGGSNRGLAIVTFRNRLLYLAAFVWGRMSPKLVSLRKWIDANVESSVGPTQGIILCEVQLYSAWSPFYLSIIARLAGNKLGARPTGFNLQFEKPPFLIRSIYEALGIPILWTKPEPENTAEIKKSVAELAAGIKTKKDLLRLKIGKVLVGDLIYDTFLRENFVATISDVEISGPRILKVMEQSVVLYKWAKKTAQEQKIRALIQDHHGYYIYHGILGRHLASLGVPVFNYADRDSAGLGKVIWSKEQSGSSHNAYWLYPEALKNLPTKEKALGLRVAEQSIKRRLKGLLDEKVLPDISAYGGCRESDLAPYLKDKRPAVLVFMHEFNDAAHCYRSSVFSDFWEWINFLCQEASKTDFCWLLKPHPATNLLGREKMKKLSQTCVEKLRQTYPRLNFISEKITNTALLQLRPASAFTMYGTVAHEMAWSGVPVVTCGDHPHIGFGFNYHAKTKRELRALIQRANTLRMQISKKQISEYLFMHYFFQQRHGLFVASLTSQPPSTTKGSSPTSILNQVLAMQKETRPKELAALKRKIALSEKLDNPLDCLSKKQR